MADVHDKKTRSYNMSMIKGKDTKPEMVVRKFLHAQGYRFRLHDKKLPGKPDIVLPRHKTIIQVHGCFWHGHENCKYASIPKTRTEWWTQKIMKTKEKDLEIEELLQENGWNTIVIFGCELKPAVKESRLKNLLKQINQDH